MSPDKKHYTGTTELIRTGADTPFAVPSGKFLVLTDIIIAPQVFPAVGQCSWGVTSSPEEFTTALVVISTPSDASSFQVHRTTGMAWERKLSI